MPTIRIDQRAENSQQKINKKRNDVRPDFWKKLKIDFKQKKNISRK